MSPFYNKNSIINISVTQCLSAIQRLCKYETRVIQEKNAEFFSTDNYKVDFHNLLMIHDDCTINNENYYMENLIKRRLKLEQKKA